jgi:hypothetical protein
MKFTLGWCKNNEMSHDRGSGVARDYYNGLHVATKYIIITWQKSRTYEFKILGLLL